MKTKRPRPPGRSARTPKKILLMDDHPMTRYGLTQLIAHEPDLEIYGEVENVQQALAFIKPPLPDLVLADISMPGKSGLEFIKDMQVQHPTVPVLVLSMHDESVYAERVLRAGGRGYIMKSEGGEKLLTAIRRILEGEVYISPGISANILNSLSKAHSENDANLISALTDRELEVFRLVGQAMSTAEISARLHISGKTVETHRLHAREKLKLKNGAELMQYAVRWAATQGII